MEILNYTQTTFSQYLIGRSTLGQETCKVDRLILEMNEKATLNINTPYFVVEETKFDTSELVTSFYILLCSFIPVIKSTPGFLLKSQWGKLICFVRMQICRVGQIYISIFHKNGQPNTTAPIHFPGFSGSPSSRGSMDSACGSWSMGCRFETHQSRW